MHSHHHIQRPPRGRSFGDAVRLLPINLAPLQVLRDAEILVEAGTGFLVRWHLASGPWPAHGSAAIGALRGFHHGILAPGATWPMHIHEDLQAVTYVVEGVLEHSDSLGNSGVLTAGGVQQRWLGWGSEHHEWNPSATARTEFIQLWLETPRPHQTALEQHHHYAREERFERWLQIVRCECSPSDGLMVAQDAEVRVIRLQPSSGFMAYQFEPGHGGYLYLIEGDMDVNLERLASATSCAATHRPICASEPSSSLRLTTRDRTPQRSLSAVPPQRSGRLVGRAARTAARTDSHAPATSQ
jgi:redox-sensitive bicupin YhaK (pirin superfamily)